MNRDSKRRFVVGYKDFTGCCRCPERRLACLEFHHVKPLNRRTSGLSYSQQRKQDVSSLVAQNKALIRIVKAIEECELLCANCHKVLTAASNGW